MQIVHTRGEFLQIEEGLKTWETYWPNISHCIPQTVIIGIKAESSFETIFIGFSELMLSLIKFFPSVNWPNSPAEFSTVELAGPQRGECVRSVSELSCDTSDCLN